jgi:hypothetical protein
MMDETGSIDGLKMHQPEERNSTGKVNAIVNSPTTNILQTIG